MLKIAIALLIGVSIGALCRYFDVPVPAPPKLIGAVLVLAITLGYIGVDTYLTREAAAAQRDELPSDS